MTSNQQPRSFGSLNVFSSQTNPSASAAGNKVPNATATNLVIQKKITNVLQLLQFSSAAQYILVQFWAPVTTEGRCFLATTDQPFALSDCNAKLYEFKQLCLDYKIYLDAETEEELGLIGRVFTHKSPELLLDVETFPRKKYPQFDHVVQCNVQGFVALPVLEPSSLTCLGVIEIVFPSDNLYSSNYRHLTNIVLDGLQAVSLQSSVEYNHFDEDTCDEALKHALHEISEVLKVVCKTYYLPLAQTWLLSRDYSVVGHGGSLKKTCLLKVLSKAVVSSCHFVYEFEWASKMVALQKGQGVAGRAYLSQRMCFSKDITQFRLVQYPLAHYARDCHLASCFAICLRSSYTGDIDYVLEFFIPRRNGEPWFMVGSLLATLKRKLQSFKFASGRELGEDLGLEVIGSFKGQSWTYFRELEALDYLVDNVGGSQPTCSSSQESPEEDSVENDATDIMTVESTKENTTSNRKPKPSISYEVLERHFGMELEVAAEKLGVSRYTLKRVCGQHKISRWPFHKRIKGTRVTQSDHPSSSKPPFEPAATMQESLSSSSEPSPEQAEVSSARQDDDERTPICMEAFRRDVLKFAYPFSSRVVDLEEEGASGSVEVSSERQDIAICKAVFGDKIFKFMLPFSCGVVDLKEEVAESVKLKIENFKISYRDEDNHLITIVCDKDLKDMLTLQSSRGTTIKMLVEQVTD